MKRIETYMIPNVGAVDIVEKIFNINNKKYDALFCKEGMDIKNYVPILTDCETRGGSRRASEGYLSALYKQEIEEVDTTKSGWLRQFQTQTPNVNSGEEK